MRPGTSVTRLCSRCLRHNRLFSSTSQLSQQQQNVAPPPPPRAGYTRLTNRALISITGIDSATFLQGIIAQNMITNDQSHTTRQTPSFTAFLNAHGRIMNDAFVYPLLKADPEAAASDGPAYLVEVDRNEVSGLMKHLRRHKLRSKLKLRVLGPGERTVWSSWKDHTEPPPAPYNLESDPALPFPVSSPITGCVDTRAPGFGLRLITPGDEDIRAHLPDEAQVPGEEVGLGSYTVRRMLHGVAEGQGEIEHSSALPLDYNMDMTRGIDFRKGCYLGQELTIRTHHTGIVRKRILPVQLYTGDLKDVATPGDVPVYDPASRLPLPPAGANISKAGGRRGRSAGKFVNGVGNIGLALCRLEMMTDIVLTGEGVQYKPGDEFKASWADGEEGVETQDAGEVKLKAIVPRWIREYILSGGVRRNHPTRKDEVE